MSAQTQQFTFDQVDETAVNSIRFLAAEMVQKANSGHPGMPMGFANVAHVLWSRFLKFNPDDPFWMGRDRFILSGGHGSALIYSMLHLAGYELTMDDLKDFRQLGSKTPGHPEFGHTPGVEVTTGPLGQGISNAIGMAAAQRYIKGRLEITEDNNPLDHFIYCEVGDGDLQEGVSNEATALGGHWKLGNLIVLWDDNSISIDGGTDISTSEDVCARFESQGWHVQTVEDGHDFEAIAQAIVNAQNETERASFISFKTHIGYGSPNKQDSSSSHGSPLGEDEIKLTREKLGWDVPAFEVPEEVYELYAKVADAGRIQSEEWKADVDKWLEANESKAGLWKQLVNGEMPENWEKLLPTFENNDKVATRGAFGKTLNSVAKELEMLVGGCADLTGSVKTDIADEDLFLPENPKGRNIRFGIREHAMGAIANGMQLYAGLKAYTGTFLVFSDYMRPTMRLAALMEIPTLFVYSHDSIGLGEDGPTHQPIEHYMALRAIPNLHVHRPGDANEVTVCWREMLKRKDGPSTIFTSRQGLPVVDRSKYADVENAARGAYVLGDCEGTPDLILIGTGGELHLAVEAYEKLTEEGYKVRVVSMPCWELFDEQDDDYINSVFPPEVTKRLSVEAGISLGWERWVGTDGESLSIESFGASAPAPLLFEKFGYTTENVINIARAMMK